MQFPVMQIFARFQLPMGKKGTGIFYFVFNLKVFWGDMTHSSELSGIGRILFVLMWVTASEHLLTCMAVCFPCPKITSLVKPTGRSSFLLTLNLHPVPPQW